MRASASVSGPKAANVVRKVNVGIVRKDSAGNARTKDSAGNVRKLRVARKASARRVRLQPPDPIVNAGNAPKKSYASVASGVKNAARNAPPSASAKRAEDCLCALVRERR